MQTNKYQRNPLISYEKLTHQKMSMSVSFDVSKWKIFRSNDGIAECCCIFPTLGQEILYSVNCEGWHPLVKVSSLELEDYPYYLHTTQAVNRHK